MVWGFLVWIEFLVTDDCKVLKTTILLCKRHDFGKQQPAMTLKTRQPFKTEQEGWKVERITKQKTTRSFKQTTILTTTSLLNDNIH